MGKPKTKKFHFAWIVLIGISIVMGLVRGGLNNAGGLFMVPVTADLGFGAGEFMLYFSISSLVTFIFLGALIFGLLSDKIGAEATAIFAMLIGVVAVVMAIFLGERPMCFKAAVGLYGIMAASIGTLGPLLTTAIFGQRDYNVIYSTVAMGMAFTSVVVLSG